MQIIKDKSRDVRILFVFLESPDNLRTKLFYDGCQRCNEKIKKDLPYLHITHPNGYYIIASIGDYRSKYIHVSEDGIYG